MGTDSVEVAPVPPGKRQVTRDTSGTNNLKRQPLGAAACRVTRDSATKLGFPGRTVSLRVACDTSHRRVATRCERESTMRPGG